MRDSDSVLSLLQVNQWESFASRRNTALTVFSWDVETSCWWWNVARRTCLLLSCYKWVVLHVPDVVSAADIRQTCMDADLCSTLGIGAGDLCPGWGVCPPPYAGDRWGRGSPLAPQGYGEKNLIYLRNHAFSCIFTKRETIRQNTWGTFTMLSPTNLLGDMSPVPLPVLAPRCKHDHDIYVCRSLPGKFGRETYRCAAG